jgi:feruloyl esterase
MGGGEFPPYDRLPAFCRVAATIRPVPDSTIKIEVWLPTENWNGKFMGVGNGGWSGEVWHPALAKALARGYAAASTDTGHEGPGLDASFAVGHPEKVIDSGWRAVHEMTVKAKAIVAAFYMRDPAFSYWDGCSTGGRQGLAEAQRFPADFDGIIIGDAANYMTRSAGHFVSVAQALHREHDSFLPPQKLQLLHSAALDACDAKDGVRDGILENPAGCPFDPNILECKAADGPTCLMPAQVAAARRVYGPSTNPRTNEPLYPGLMPGSELGWSAPNGQVREEAPMIPTALFRYVVFKDPKWDYRTFDFDRDTTLADMGDAAVLNAINPNLTPFFARGGKLLQYHGWDDNQISPLNSINYLHSVEDLVGPEVVARSYRLFMVPGMGHCRDGAGPNVFDAVTAIERWVENGQPPQQIIAAKISNGKIERTRPLCPYPQVAVYKGTGSTDDATNFICRDQPN